MPITLKDLARQLNLSVPTVSLALRNAGTISATTCARVQALAKKVGYTPNLYAAALSTKQKAPDTHAMPVALIRLRTPHGYPYPTPPFAEAIMQQAQQFGYHIEQHDIDSLSQLDQSLFTLYHQGVQGLFLPPMGVDATELGIDWSRFSILCCGRNEFSNLFHTIRPEIFENTREAFLQCSQRGYQRIGAALFWHEPRIKDDFARAGAIQCAQQEAQSNAHLPIFFSRSAATQDDNLGLQGFTDWFEKQRPDVVIGFSVAHYYALLKLGVRIPEDVGFLTLHASDDPYCHHISGMVERFEALGLAAVRQMDSMIRHHQHGFADAPQHTVISGEWKEGETLRELG